MSQQGDPNLIQHCSGIGQRLRDARGAASLSLAEVGQRLKMPVRVVESLESEDWSRLGAPVFVRGQLRSYARLLGLPVDLVVQMPDVSPVVASDLKPMTHTPPMQRFAEQAQRKAIYIVLTAAIIVPVWLATRPHIVQIARDAAPLDVPAGGVASQPAANQPRQREPMMASLTPMPARSQAAALALHLDGDSWVEVIGNDGRVLESGLLKAGEERSYAAGEVARMVLGNAGAARLLRQGEVQDLAPYARSNVARITVSSDGSLAPPAD